VNPAWYDALYGDDPSTDNIFGREDLAPRHNPALLAFLAQGGRLSDYPPALSTLSSPALVLAAIDRALS
jgi:hypothetical protein